MSDIQLDSLTKVALFMHPKYGTLISIYTEQQASGTTYVRCSQWIEVNFPSLSKDAVISFRIKALDAEIEDTLRVATKEVESIRDIQKQLLAIAYDKPQDTFDTVTETVSKTINSIHPEDDIPF